MNRYDKNRQVIKECINYKTIINYDFMPEDKIIDRLIIIYQQYITEVSLNSKKDLKTVKDLDKIIYKYLTDHKFKKVMTKELTDFKVKDSVKDVIRYVVDSIVDIYEKYMDGYTRNIVIPRWI